MEQKTRSLPWVTPAKYVGPAMVIILLVAGLLAGWFAIEGRFNDAIITLLFATCFLLVGIADLLGELIMLSEKKGQRPDL